MAAQDEALRSGKVSDRARFFLVTLAVAVGVYVVTGGVLLSIFSAFVGQDSRAWTDVEDDVYLALFVFHAVLLVAVSPLVARLFTAPVLPVLVATAVLLAAPWVASLDLVPHWPSGIGTPNTSVVPHPSPKPGDHVERTPPASGPWTIEEAQRFEGYALFWLGPEFRGLPITEIRHTPFVARVSGPDVDEEVRFVYGTCEITGFEGGCHVPIWISVEPNCEKEELRVRPKTVSLRGGAEMARYGDILLVWTADASIEIGGHFAEEDVARALVAMNRPSPATANDPLPPPISVEC